MALTDDLRRLTARSITELNASHDYYINTLAVWRFVRRFIVDGGKLTIENKATGSVVDQHALLGRMQSYAADYLRVSTFLHFVSLFEDFFFDLLRLWLTAHPHSLSRRQVDLGTILQTGDTSIILQNVIDRELNSLKYEKLADWFVYLDKLVHLGCPTPSEIEALAEIKASRDILTHNRGLVNPIYLAKAGGKARFQDGERLELPEQYHRTSWELVKTVVRNLGDAAAAKA